MKIVFMGSSEFAVAAISALLDSEHKLELIVTQPDKPAGRGQHLTPCPAAEFAQENSLPVSKPAKIKGNLEFFETLKKINPDCIVVAAYGKILPKEILGLPRFGCVNIHASLLPKFRGAAPINWAIIKGEPRTGVTTMFMNEKMDEGDILLQCSTEIDSHDTAETLHDHLAILGGELLLKTLSLLEKGEIKAIPQEHKSATYAPILKKEDGKIDWKLAATSICNRIRGLNPWPGTFTELPDGTILKIFDAAPIEEETKEKPGTVIDTKGGIIIATGFGKLCVLEVQASGKKRMSAKDFLAGHNITKGAVLK